VEREYYINEAGRTPVEVGGKRSKKKRANGRFSRGVCNKSTHPS